MQVKSRSGFNGFLSTASPFQLFKRAGLSAINGFTINLHPTTDGLQVIYRSNWPNKASAPDFGRYRRAAEKSDLFHLVETPEDEENLDEQFKKRLDREK